MHSLNAYPTPRRMTCCNLRRHILLQPLLWRHVNPHACSFKSLFDFFFFYGCFSAPSNPVQPKKTAAKILGTGDGSTAHPEEAPEGKGSAVASEAHSSDVLPDPSASRGWGSARAPQTSKRPKEKLSQPVPSAPPPSQSESDPLPGLWGSYALHSCEFL